MEAYLRLMRLAHGADQIAQARQLPLLSQHLYRECMLLQSQLNQQGADLAVAMAELGAITMELQILRDELREGSKE